MAIKLHKQATNTKVRVEVQTTPTSISDSELTRQYGVSDATIRQWR